MRRRLRGWASACAAVGVLAVATPVIGPSSAAGAAPPVAPAPAAATPPPQLAFDEAQALAANGPFIAADETRVCGATGGRRFLAEILQGSPLDYKIPFRLADIVDGNTKPTSMAHKQMMVSGTVGDSVLGSGDFPFDHPFGSDFNMNVIPDPAFASLSQEGGQVVNHPIHTELSAGLLPHSVQPTGAPTGETWADNGARARTNILPGFLPVAGDRVIVQGEWVNDCGHPPFQTELHEISFMAWSHTEGTKTIVQTFYNPYRPSQLYNFDKTKANTAVANPSLFTVWDYGRPSFPQYLINEVLFLKGKGSPPYNSIDHVESWAMIDGNRKSPVDWQVCAPPAAQAGSTLSVNYDFVTRTGVQINATPDQATGCATLHTALGTSKLVDPPLRVCTTPWTFLDQVAAEEAGVPGLDLKAEFANFVGPENAWKLDADPIMGCYDSIQGPPPANNLTGQHVTTDDTMQAPFWGRVELSWQAPTPTSSTTSSSSTSSSTSSSSSSTTAAQVSMTVTPATVPQGGTVTVASSGWKPGSTVTVTVDGSTSLGTATVNADGTISSPFTLPSSVGAGKHAVTLTGTMSDGTQKTLSADITVTAAATSTLASTSSSAGPTVITSGSLPTTGADIAGAVAVGSLLALGGIGLVAATRRRQPVAR